MVSSKNKNVKNKVKKGLVGILGASMLATAATPAALAQSDNKIGVFIRIPFTLQEKGYNSEKTFGDVEIGVYGQTVTVKSGNKVMGAEVDFGYRPANSDFSTSTSFIGGSCDFVGKIGVGYDLKKGAFIKPAMQYDYLDLGMKYYPNENNLELFIGANTGGGFSKYHKSKSNYITNPSSSSSSPSSGSSSSSSSSGSSSSGLPIIDTPV